MHQRRFAGAVLADDGVDLARAKANVDVADRENAGESLGNPGDLDDVRARRHRSPFETPYFLATLSIFSFV